MSTAARDSRHAQTETKPEPAEAPAGDTQAEKTRPARGVLLGTGLGAVIWAAIIYLISKIW
jgi:hypothetical protein